MENSKTNKTFLLEEKNETKTDIDLLFENTNNKISKNLSLISSALIQQDPTIAYSKENPLYSFQIYMNNHSFLKREFFYILMEQNLNLINFEDFFSKLQNYLNFLKNLDKPQNFNCTVLKNKIEFINQEYISLLAENNQREKEKSEISNKLKTNVQEIKEAEIKYNKEIELIENELENIHNIFISEIDEKIKKILDFEILKEKEFIFMNSYNFFKKKFEEIIKYFIEKKELRKIEFFNLDNLNIFVNNEKMKSQKNLKIKNEELLFYINKNEKIGKINMEEANHISICSKKKELALKEKELINIIKKKEDLENKLAKKKKDNYKIINILSQQSLIEKISESLHDKEFILLGVFILIFLIILLYINFVNFFNYLDGNKIHN